MKSGCPWDLASPFPSKKAHSEEQNPVCRGIGETFVPSSLSRCFVRGVGREARQGYWMWYELSGRDELEGTLVVERSWADKACWDLRWLGTVPGGRLLPCWEGSAFPLFPGLLTLSRPI